MIRMRPLLALFLCTVIVATGGAMAAARGQAAVAGQIVLCTGSGPVTVEVDAQGQPVGPVHICPDCAMSLLAAVAAPPLTEAGFAARTTALSFGTASRRAARAPVTRPRARAPPIA